ncbi:Hypothetical predicted protein [Lecanosticta acicola]|uniref:Uncharacterized protein n=1 Tax=Lecanosticta acicola TaxID=111012 RepID=A0AAI9EDJ1_9PEZI|nr:Hypothetical predicted protein [Lecanosticta acicola]
MKLSLALLSAAIAVSAAQPHRHGHQHLHKEKRAPDAAPDYATVPGPTEIVYVLNGKPIPESEVQQGIKNGSLVFASNGELSSKSSSAPAPPSYAAPSSSAPSSSSAPISSSAPTSSSAPPTTSSSSTYVAPTTSAVQTSSAAPSYAVASKAYSAPASSSSSAAAPSYGGGDDSSSSGDSTGVDSEFPDGTIDCSTFPSEYGAVAADWLGLGGWTGIQNCPDEVSAGFTNIETVTSGGSCTEGHYCSYACPPGWQKSQWPTTQGSTGQSVGGIQCKNGKLHLTNPDMSKSLCMKGAEEVTILVQNNLSKNVSVCRTDYPGTESETIPVSAPAGGTANLTCPSADNYYKWQGSSTSAQYYVNPAGVSVEDGCQWGSPENPWGNYAPLNLGVGYSNGAAWLSIFQNSPTTTAKLDFTVEIEGDGISGTCKYQNGQYCGGANFDQCSETTGCTVSISSGTATFVFSD